MATNQHVERGPFTTPIEDEISRLGFDYNRMLERGFYPRNDYALFMDTLKLNLDPAQDFHHEVRVEFGVYCTDNRRPFAINHMVVKLKKFDNSSHEGQQVQYAYYPAGKQFPTREQIWSEMKQILQSHEAPELKSTTQAQKVLAGMNETRQSESNSLKRGL